MTTILVLLSALAIVGAVVGWVIAFAEENRANRAIDMADGDRRTTKGLRELNEALRRKLAWAERHQQSQADELARQVAARVRLAELLQTAEEANTALTARLERVRRALESPE